MRLIFLKFVRKYCSIFKDNSDNSTKTLLGWKKTYASAIRSFVVAGVGVVLFV